MVIRHTIQAFTPCLFIVRYILHTEEHVHRVCTVFKIIKWPPVWKERHVLPAPQFPHTMPLPLGKIIVTLMLVTMTPLPLKVRVNASRYAWTATAGFCLLADLSEMEAYPSASCSFTQYYVSEIGSYDLSYNCSVFISIADLHWFSTTIYLFSWRWTFNLARFYSLAV